MAIEKKLSEVELLEQVTSDVNVVCEQGGSWRRLNPKTQFVTKDQTELAIGGNLSVYSPYSYVYGYDNSVGGRCFKVLSSRELSDDEKQTLNLTSTNISYGLYVLDSVEGLEVNMVYSVNLKYTNYRAGTIKYIDTDTNSVYVSGFIYSDLNTTDTDTEIMIYNQFIIDGHPELGTYECGSGSCSEGTGNKVQNSLSHAEGRNNVVLGRYSHAEGLSNTVSHTAHAEGAYNIAVGAQSHCEGRYNEAKGIASHTEGRNNTASGIAAHAEGSGNTAKGNHSHSEGENTTASGIAAHAEGISSTAPGDYAHAEGYQTYAEGNSSHSEGVQTFSTAKASHAEGLYTYATTDSAHAEGYKAIASGSASHAEGANTQAKGNNSHAEGYNTTTSGSASHAEGGNTKALGTYSHAEGANSTATGTGSYSHAEGYNTITSGIAAHAEGFNIKASSNYQHVQGKYNVEDAKNIYAHIVGNGTTDGLRSNAHTIDWDGNATFAGLVSSKGEDYAEFFEWQDGNPDNEDRVGLLVALDGEKIRLANADDEVLGIISGTVAVLGGNYEWEWNGKYLTDDFGRVIYDLVEKFIDVENVTYRDVEKEIVDKETNETRIEIVTEAIITTEKQSSGFWKYPRLNPEYDPEQKYIRRSDRPEWDTVGMLGKLYVRDDGTATVNGYITVGENGIATASSKKTNMRVLSRVNENVVRVLLK
jgi:hypothetical protein